MGLPCCVQAVSGGGEQGLVFIVVLQLLRTAASLVAEGRL